MLKTLLRNALARHGVELRRNHWQDPIAVQRALVTTNDPVILDVGAHHGEVSARYRQLFPTARIHAFEPFPKSLKMLRDRVGRDTQVTIHALALSNATGTAHFHVNASDATNSLLATDGRADEAWGPGLVNTQETIDVPTDTLDRVAEAAGMSHIDIMKIDVQGAEYQVFEGARSLLSRGAIDLILTEVITAPTYDGQHALHDYLALFAAHGYLPMDFYNPIRRRGWLLQTDVLFISPRLRDTAPRLTG